MTDELATGVYVIRLYDEDNKKIDSKKLVVRHQLRLFFGVKYSCKSPM